MGGIDRARSNESRAASRFVFIDRKHVFPQQDEGLTACVEINPIMATHVRELLQQLECEERLP